MIKLVHYFQQFNIPTKCVHFERLQFHRGTLSDTCFIFSGSIHEFLKRSQSKLENKNLFPYQLGEQTLGFSDGHIAVVVKQDVNTAFDIEPDKLLMPCFSYMSSPNTTNTIQKGAATAKDEGERVGGQRSDRCNDSYAVNKQNYFITVTSFMTTNITPLEEPNK